MNDNTKTQVVNMRRRDFAMEDKIVQIKKAEGVNLQLINKPNKQTKLKSEIPFGVIITDILNHLTYKINIRRQFPFFYIFSK